MNDVCKVTFCITIILNTHHFRNIHYLQLLTTTCITMVLDILERLEKVFESRIRLGIMLLLMIHQKMDFVTLKKTLSSSFKKNVTDGNLASHLKILHTLAYIEEDKKYVNRKSHTIYIANEKGKIATQAYLDAMKEIIENVEERAI